MWGDAAPKNRVEERPRTSLTCSPTKPSTCSSTRGSHRSQVTGHMSYHLIELTRQPQFLLRIKCHLHLLPDTSVTRAVQNSNRRQLHIKRHHQHRSRQPCLLPAPPTPTDPLSVGCVLVENCIIGVYTRMCTPFAYLRNY